MSTNPYEPPKGESIHGKWQIGQATLQLFPDGSFTTYWDGKVSSQGHYEMVESGNQIVLTYEHSNPAAMQIRHPYWIRHLSADRLILEHPRSKERFESVRVEA